MRCSSWWPALLPALVACACGRLSTRGTAEPPFSEWPACFVPNAHLDAYPSAETEGLDFDPGGTAVPGPPDRAVVRVSADWAKSACRTEHVGGTLMFDLALPLRVGEPQTFSGVGWSDYVEGSFVARRSKVRGTVTPRAILADHVTLVVSLETIDPIWDGPRTLAGVIEARRITWEACILP
jgi:hypothetical protein